MLSNTLSQPHDVVIVGTGSAGLSLALRLADTYRVLLLSKGNLEECATHYAQGGIAAVFDEHHDSITAHIEDTLIAGAGLCNRQTVRFVAENGRHCLQWLIDQGMPFDKQHHATGHEEYHLTREGGHSQRRILHSKDATGAALQETLTKRARQHRHITIEEQCCVIDVITSAAPGTTGKKNISGVTWLNTRTQQLVTLSAPIVVLATGGAARLYQHSTNPAPLSGDGIAIAWRAGCSVANMEFNQFHPTTLFVPGSTALLLSEALRGEGAYLTRRDGSRFMPEIDPRAELAPRDIVARAITGEMLKSTMECVYLDLRHRPAESVRAHFPTITNLLHQHGLDITADLIPIVPAAHYTCGGVVVDTAGKTDINGLYTIGETSYTGLHGGNRLASNSLLECLVYGWSAASAIHQQLSETTTPVVPALQREYPDSHSDSQVVTTHISTLKKLVSEHAGIIRQRDSLETGYQRVLSLHQKVQHIFSTHFPSQELIELRNLADVALLILRCARQREQSCGLHYLSDSPDAASAPLPTILTPD